MMLHQFIDTLSLPACAVREQDGVLLHMNRKLGGYLSGNISDTPLRCSWIVRNTASCPEDAEIMTLNGRCLFPLEEAPLLLVSAFRLINHAGALLRLYATPDNLTTHATVEATHRAYRFAMGEPLAPLRFDNPYPERTLLDLIHEALRHPHTREATAEVNVPSSIRITHDGAFPLSRLLERFIAEGAALAPKKRLSLTYRRAENRQHQIELSTEKLRLTKGTTSLARASHLRLIAFANRVASVTRFPLHPIEYSFEQDRIRFALSFDSGPHLPPPAPLLPPVYASLSAREQEVAELIVTSVDPEVIGQKLSIKTSTVKQHLKNIYEKTKVRNRLELLALLRVGD